MHLQFFAYATLLKAVPGFQYILNILNVAGSADADARRLRFADVDANATLPTRMQMRTQNSGIHTSLVKWFSGIVVKMGKLTTKRP